VRAQADEWVPNLPPILVQAKGSKSRGWGQKAGEAKSIGHYALMQWNRSVGYALHEQRKYENQFSFYFFSMLNEAK